MIVFCNKIESIQKETTRYMLSLSLSLLTHLLLALAMPPLFQRNYFFPANFRLSTLIHLRNVVSGFGKKGSASLGARQPGKT